MLLRKCNYDARVYVHKVSGANSNASTRLRNHPTRVSVEHAASFPSQHDQYYSQHTTDFLSLKTSIVIRAKEEQPKVSSIIILIAVGLLPPLLYSQAWFEMIQMRLQKAKANTMEICWSWYYHSSPSSCILLLCSTDQSVSPAMLLPAQSILDSAYINAQCPTNGGRSFNWITRSAAFPLVRLEGSGHGAHSPLRWVSEGSDSSSSLTTYRCQMFDWWSVVGIGVYWSMTV